jgi:uncharacterized protein YaaR (DUF327 family)
MSMKVQNVKTADPGRFPARVPDNRGLQEGERTTFRRKLTDLSKEMHEARLMGMKKDIDEQGARLAERADVKEFEKYRRLIREFLGEIVSNGYSFSREDAYASRGRRRFTATVKIVDAKLDELGKEVIKEQSDKIDILHRIDDIRGLLLDLLL